MRQLEGFEEAGKEHLVWRLRKALYGLKQAGRTWHQTIDPALQGLSLTPLASDYCVYTHRNKQGDLLILALYVDDLFFFSPSLTLLTRFKVELHRLFRMEDLGEVRLMLGMRITRDRTCAQPDHLAVGLRGAAAGSSRRAAQRGVYAYAAGPAAVCARRRAQG